MGNATSQYFEKAFNNYFGNNIPNRIEGDTVKDLRSRVNDELQRAKVVPLKRHFVQNELQIFLQEILGYRLRKETDGWKTKWVYVLEG